VAKTKLRKTANAPDAARKTDEAGTKTGPSHDLLIAAIGASAGGLEAGIDLVRNLDPNTGMAYVFIQHLDPTHSSIIKDLLAKETSMPVTEVTDGTRVAPNHIYVIPPNALMTIDDHTLRLSPRELSRGGHMPIDHFMRVLAEDLGNRAIGVILSGTGSDGVLGMAEIQARGGVTFAQDQVTAKYDGMPRSAIAAGCVDYVLPPQGIAGELARLAHHPYVSPSRSLDDVPPLVQPGVDGINTIFQILRRATRVDFTYYRKTTILRRIQRRMVVHKIDKFSEYVKYLQSSPAEIKALYQDMLIHVTSFFRNPKTFESLKRAVFPQILKNKQTNSNIRIWIPGCASGEEAYSLAIALLEFLGPKLPDIPIQLFGTDISETSIKMARAGIYPANIQGDVSPERIRRFFAKVEGGYRINKNIREMCIFAQHNLLNDPPFSRMDLICCRNLLIYFEPVLQARVISLFHYSLRAGGYLILGTSEGISAAAHLFNLEDRENKIFSKKASTGRQMVTFSLNRQPEQSLTMHESPWSGRPLRAETNWNYAESQRDFDRRLLAHYVPPTVFVNEDMEIIHTRGRFNRYFKMPAGRPTLNVLKMAHDDLMLSLQNAILAAKKEKRPVSRTGITVKVTNGKKGASRKENVAFEVTPLRSGLNELCFMIVFREEGSPWKPGKSRKGGSHSKQRKDSSNEEIKRLEQELATAKEHLQSVVENQEAANEELQSANEEILSSNEELQSTNEELETAKEELQSTNEELSTVNDELRNRNLQMSEGQKELRDLLTGVSIAVVGNDSQIREFASESRKLLSLLPEEIGGPILDVNRPVDIPNFQQLIKQALSNSAAGGEYVVDRAGKRYRVRVLPLKGTDETIDGHIVALIDSDIAERLSKKSQLPPEKAGEDDKNEEPTA
jgi:two-component system, chemotaxis family, CheB/CheR fusion protein